MYVFLFDQKQISISSYFFIESTCIEAVFAILLRLGQIILPQFSINISRAWTVECHRKPFFFSLANSRRRRFLHFNYVILFNLFIFTLYVCANEIIAHYQTVILQLAGDFNVHSTDANAWKVHFQFPTIFAYNANGIRRLFWLFNLRLASHKLPASINSWDLLFCSVLT